MVQSSFRFLAISSLFTIVRAYDVEFGLAHQCGPVEVAWSLSATSGAQPVYPVYLNIIPFNSTATMQEITGWNATRTSGFANLKFNFPAGTKYLLGVTDSTGNGFGGTSSIRRALQSPTGDTSCLAPNSSQIPKDRLLYEVSKHSKNNQLTLNVKWDPSIQSPVLRLFVPKMTPMNVGVLGGTTLAIPLPCEQMDSDQATAVVLFGNSTTGTFNTSQVSLANSSCLEATNPSVTDSGFGVHPVAAARTIGYTTAGILFVVILVFLITRYQKRHPNVQRGIITGEGIYPPPEPPPEMVKSAPSDRPASLVWNIPVYVRRPGVTVLGPGPFTSTAQSEPIKSLPPIVTSLQTSSPAEPSIISSPFTIGHSSPQENTGTRPLAIVKVQRNSDRSVTPSRKRRPSTAPPLSFNFNRGSLPPSFRRTSEASTVRTVSSPQDTESPQDQVPLPESEPVPDSPTVPEFLRLPSFRFSMSSMPKLIKTRSQQSIQRSTYLELLEDWEGKGFKLPHSRSGTVSSRTTSTKPPSRTGTSSKRASSKSRSSKRNGSGDKTPSVDKQSTQDTPEINVVQSMP
ncbi:hypothetical protein M422DRAFT_68443 [Sphaerobolus stellatus SS14]|uniref:Uncharacterized protein n=1 Tax=Sphaerobolus stellatus (strain SS14) TaxID=990650 RepID=A0A0C9VHR4_SPHS4|nr:hypothetical protein M422DRAFT_68443 [Sphaerobolus stellatus SS14]